MLSLIMVAQMIPSGAQNAVPRYMLLAALFWLAIAALLILPALMVYRSRRKARQMGYPSYRAYLRAVPKDDREKRDAIDLTARGVVLCLLGVLFPPFIILGLTPLYYGGRKLAMLGAGVNPTPPADPDTPRKSA